MCGSGSALLCWVGRQGRVGRAVKCGGVFWGWGVGGGETAREQEEKKARKGSLSYVAADNERNRQNAPEQVAEDAFVRHVHRAGQPQDLCVYACVYVRACVYVCVCVFWGAG